MSEIPQYFKFDITSEKETDLVLVSLTDLRSGFVVRTAMPNHGKLTASIMAFAGARFSRADITAVELFKEIKNAKKNANERLSTIFRAYGHASVADMAQLFCYIENVPQNIAQRLFYESSVGGGQERSTRYQDFTGSNLDDLKSKLSSFDINKDILDDLSLKWENLQRKGLSNYTKWVEILTKKYTEVYKLDKNNKKEVGALKARVFDTARAHLPYGACNRTSLAYITSAREWARLVSVFKASKDFQLEFLAEQLEFLFAPSPEIAKEIGYVPEAPDLIRYTSGDETTSQSLDELRGYLVEIGFNNIMKLANDSIEKQENNVYLFDLNIPTSHLCLMYNITTLYPDVNKLWLLEWIKNLEDQQKTHIGNILLGNFNHHKQTPNQYKIYPYTFELIGSIAEIRDLNRHRAWGRFTPMLVSHNIEAIINDGYVLPLYLTQNNSLKDEAVEFENDLNSYYSSFREFYELAIKTDYFPKSLIKQLLPFAHCQKSYFSASIKELSYMTKLRVRPGGQINYRDHAYKIAELASQKDPFLVGVKIDKKPDPCSKEEFVDRS